MLCQSAFLTLSFIIVLSCASPNTYRPDVSQEELDSEMIIQMEDTFRLSMAREARLDSIVETIVWKNATLCGDNVKKRYGFYYLDTPTMNKSKRSRIYKRLLLRYHKLSEVASFPTITDIVPNSPADSSDLRIGDAIIKVDGQDVQENKRKKVVYKKGSPRRRSAKTVLFKGDTNFIPLLELSHNMTGPVPFTIKRGDSTLVISMKSSSTCNYSASVVDNATVNAWTDGSHIYVATGMLDFSSDDDLALVVSHEMAHCTEGHIAKKKGNMLTGLILGSIAQTVLTSDGAPWHGPQLGTEGAKAGASLYSQEFEEEADYVGMYLMARAGYSTKGVENFWRRMAEFNPIKSNSFSGTHPPTSKRYLLLSKTHHEIEIKKSRGEDLLPARKGNYIQ